MEILRERWPWCELLRLVEGGGFGYRGVEDWGGEAGYGGVVGGRLEVEDDDFVFACAEPGAGDVEGLLGAYVPEAADGVAVDPEGSLGEVADVEEGVAGGG